MPQGIGSIIAPLTGTLIFAFIMYRIYIAIKLFLIGIIRGARENQSNKEYGMQPVRTSLVDGAIIIACLLAVSYFSLNIRPAIVAMWHCPDAHHCTLTIANHGGGFDRGFNPSDAWHAIDIPAGVHFAQVAGVLPAGHRVQVAIVIDTITCPLSLAYADTWEESIDNLSSANTLTGQCAVLP